VECRGGRVNRQRRGRWSGGVPLPLMHDRVACLQISGFDVALCLDYQGHYYQGAFFHRRVSNACKGKCRLIFDIRQRL
jgi:hypothetical protein